MSTLKINDLSLFRDIVCREMDKGESVINAFRFAVYESAAESKHLDVGEVVSCVGVWCSNCPIHCVKEDAYADILTPLKAEQLRTLLRTGEVEIDDEVQN